MGDSREEVTNKPVYTNKGLSETSSSPQDYQIINKVEVLIKALGTMVIFPQFEADPNNIGKKNFIGPVQQPILQDGDRKVVVDKLVELINKL